MGREGQQDFAAYLSTDRELANGTIWQRCMWLKGVVMRAHYNGKMRQGLPEPEYQSDGYTVKIVFWKSAQKKEEASQMSSQKDESASQKSDNTSQKKLGTSQKAIMQIIGENPNVTTSDIANRIGIDRRNVQEHIKKLQELGVLHREGGRKNGKWIIDKI